jgi:hypothetical protein
MQQQLQREIDGSYGRPNGSQPTTKVHTSTREKKSWEYYSLNCATGRRTGSLVQDDEDDEEMIQM